jgi:hypothetical protein
MAKINEIQLDDLAASKITSGTFVDARISQSSVVQHEGALDHTGILNIGTNTHAQIDTHIADATIHFTQAAISIPASQISDFDTEVTNNVTVVANTAKVSNATHTGDVAGSTVLTIQPGAVDIAMLSATGTPSSSTYLRGDNTWATISGTPVATSLISGTVELFSDTVQAIAANAVSATVSRTYGLQINGDGQLVVNVPWTNTTYTEISIANIQNITSSTTGLITGRRMESYANNRGLTTTAISNWNTAFGWGDHSGLYMPIGQQLAQTKNVVAGEFFTSYNATTGLFTSAVPNYFSPSSLFTDYGFTDNSTNWNTAFGWGDHSGLYMPIGQQLAQTKSVLPGEFLTSYNATTGLFTSATPNYFSPSSLLADYGFTDNSTNWNTAFGWGDHGAVGYLESLTTGNSTFVSLVDSGTATDPILTPSLSATGTPSSSTYLRGDNTWATISAPVFSGSIAANQVAYGTGANTIGGSSALTFDGTILTKSGYNTSSYTLRVGDLLFQPYSLGSSLVLDNGYYNGSNYTRVNTGYASGFQFNTGQFMVFGAASGSGTFSQVVAQKVDYAGNMGVGAMNNVAGNFSGARFKVHGGTGLSVATFDANGVNTRVNINSTANAGVAFQIGSASKFSLACYQAAAGNYDMVYWNEQTASASLFIDGDTNSTIIGSTTVTASSLLSIESTTKGFLQPRLTTAQKNAIASPAAGLSVYDSTLTKPSYYNGTAWVELAGGDVYKSGTPVDNQVAIWIDDETIIGSGEFTYDYSGLRLDVGGDVYVNNGDLLFTNGASAIQLGHATDTSITRASAGQVAIEGVQVVTVSNIVELTEKRITKRVKTTTTSATPTLNTDDYDYHNITALDTNITNMSTNLSGTPNVGDELWISIADDLSGTYSITWGASFIDAYGILPPNTNGGGDKFISHFTWDEVNSAWAALSFTRSIP